MTKRQGRQAQYQLFPDLPQDEYDDLKADIAKRGVLVPIEFDEAGNVLDGHHRLRAAGELNAGGHTIEVPRVTRILGSEEEKRRYILAINALRRHLSPSQRAALAVELVLPEKEAAASGRERGGKAIDPMANVPQGAATDLAGAVLHVGGRYVRKAKKILAAGHADLFAGLKDGTLDMRGAERKAKERTRETKRAANKKIVEQAPPLTAIAADGETFQTIAIDPPWDFGDEGDWDPYGRSRPTYNQMPFEEIVALPVGELAAPNSHIYLWITNRSLPKGFQLLDAWGFRYVTTITWAKPSFGMGQYFRGQTEQILFGVRGSLPLLRQDVGTLLAAERPRQHSEKPDEFYELVEACSPGPWLEVFSRKERPGWVVWGEKVTAVG